MTEPAEQNRRGGNKGSKSLTCNRWQHLCIPDLHCLRRTTQIVRFAFYDPFALQSEKPGLPGIGIISITPPEHISVRLEIIMVSWADRKALTASINIINRKETYDGISFLRYVFIYLTPLYCTIFIKAVSRSWLSSTIPSYPSFSFCYNSTYNLQSAESRKIWLDTRTVIPWSGKLQSSGAVLNTQGSRPFTGSPEPETLDVPEEQCIPSLCFIPRRKFPAGFFLCQSDLQSSTSLIRFCFPQDQSPCPFRFSQAEDFRKQAEFQSGLSISFPRSFLLFPWKIICRNHPASKLLHHF